MLRTGGAILILVLVVAAGGTLAVAAGVVSFDDGDTAPSPGTETPTPAPTETPGESMSTASPTPVETVTPVSTETPTPAPTETPTDGVDRPTAVSMYVYVGNESEGIDSGSLTVYDEDGAVVGEQDLDQRSAATVDGLEPGHNYTAEITEVGVGNIWPDKRVTFDPGEVDQLDIDVEFEFQSADAYRYQLRHWRANETNEWNARWYALGKVAEDDAYERVGQYVDLESSRFDPYQMLLVDNEIYLKVDFAWKEWHHFDYNPHRMPEHKLVQESLTILEDRTQRTFLGTRTLNDSTVYENLTQQILDEEDNWDRTNHTTPPEVLNGTQTYVFEVSFEGYSDWSETEYNYSSARVYVDPETGHVLRWQSERVLSVNGMVDGHHLVIDFWEHGEPEIDSEDYHLPDKLLQLGRADIRQSRTAI